MLVEAIHALSETIVGEPETIDTSLILGTGFPTTRRGLLRWADTIAQKDRCSSRSLRTPGRSLQSTPDVDPVGAHRQRLLMPISRKMPPAITKEFIG